MRRLGVLFNWVRLWMWRYRTNKLHIATKSLRNHWIIPVFQSYDAETWFDRTTRVLAVEARKGTMDFAPGEEGTRAREVQ